VALEVNPQVERLHRYQPFHANSADLVHEQAGLGESSFPTVALSFVAEAIEQPRTLLVVLTGDAGHGKTHLCARLLEHLGLEPSEALAAILERADGAAAITTTRSGRPLRIVKDLSDVSDDRSPGLLETLLSLDDGTVSVVCANEGRLRRAVADGGDALKVLTATLELGLEVGAIAGVDDRVHIVNLNFQSVAPDEKVGLADWALRTNLDGRRWRICRSCDAQVQCPIFANQRLLTDDRLGEQRRGGLRTLFSTAERAGAVVTIRQALAILAYTITGGLRCTDVHRRWQRNPSDRSWQSPYAYHQSVFGDRLTRDQRSQVPSLAMLRRLDPGKIALRAVDDVVEPTESGDDFVPSLPDRAEGSPQTRRDAQRESEAVRALVRFLRRRDFFDRTEGPGLLERTGLRAGAAFESAATGVLSGQAAVDVRDRLLRGVEAAQGVRRGGQPADLLVLDPAFVTHQSRAAIVANRIQSRTVEIVSQVEQWRRMGNDSPDLPRAADWIFRRSYLRVGEGQLEVSIPLDLLRFELLYRWAGGLSARHQHEAHIRHLNAALGRLVPTSGDLDEITVLVGGDRRTLTIDVGERIRSGEA
jgi:hypothetical protein